MIERIKNYFLKDDREKIEERFIRLERTLEFCENKVLKIIELDLESLIKKQKKTIDRDIEVVSNQSEELRDALKVLKDLIKIETFKRVELEKSIIQKIDIQQKTNSRFVDFITLQLNKYKLKD